VTRPRAFLPLVLAIAAVSTSAPFIRWAAPAPALTVAALRVVIAAAVLWAIGGRRAPAAWRALSARDRGWVVVAGLLFGLHLGVWIASLYFTSTAASVAIVATNPVFSALFGLLLGDRVRRREWQGIAVAALGCAIIGGRDWSAGGGALIGDGLALAGAATAAGYLVVGRRLREAMPLVPYLALVNTVAGAGLLIVAVAAGAPLVGLPTHSYVAIACCALIPSIVGHTLLNDAVRRIPTHLVTLSILGEPVGASLITWAWFGERPPLNAAIGGAIILVGIALGFAGRRVPPPEAT